MAEPPCSGRLAATVMSATDHAAVERWLTGYRRAWQSDHPDDIAALWMKRGDSGAAWTF